MIDKKLTKGNYLVSPSITVNFDHNHKIKIIFHFIFFTLIMTTRKRTYSKFTSGRNKKKRTIQPFTKSVTIPRKPKSSLLTEVKAFDYSYVNTRYLPTAANVTGLDAFLSGSATGGMTCINLPVQGSTVNERIGSKITTKALTIRFRFSTLFTNYTSLSCRILVVHDHQPNNAYPTIATILQDTSGNTRFLTSTNMGFRDRFKILRDKIITFNKNANTGYAGKSFLMPNIQCSYSASTGAMTDITTGALYVIMFSNYADANDNVIIDSLYTRLRYYDF